MAARAAQLQDYFTVELQTPTGQLLPCIEYDGMRYFVGEPGQEFLVAVSMVNYTKQDYRVTLRLDGQDPGYCVIYHGTNNTYKYIFQGWLTQSGSFTGPCATTFRLFKLASCRPSQAAPTVSSTDDLSVGRIEVKLDRVMNTGMQQQSVTVTQAGPSRDAADKKLPEGKKWFQAPGLKADAGGLKATATSWSTTIYQTVSSLRSLHVRYDSSEALYLRKALLPRFAPHRAILRKSANPAIAALGIEPSTAAPGEVTSRANVAAAAAAGGGPVKDEAAGVKRERGADDDDYVPRSATAADRIDLTEEPVRPMCVNGRQLAPDELAVCDLCDSDDEGAAAPKWQVKKKQHVDVDEV